MTIVTNNPDVKSKYEGDHTVIFVEGGYKDVLVKVRDLVHEGHQLLTHPLMGSLKPNETPYRSIAVSAQKGPVDTDSVILISESIETFDNFAKIDRPDRGTNTPERLLADFRLIDLTLISSAVDFH
ncbi:MAG: GrdX family protein, partial [Oscillospiraceae bacterium]|nr:GrdX family protein [Oscillospiraceae bacterium]